MTAVVSVSDAFVAYPSPAGTKMALRGLDLTVQAGERLLIQGPNGSGKSTLLRMLTGEQAATAGSVLVDGTDLTRLSSSARRRWRRAGVGMVDQHARRALLPEWRVVENVALQLRLAGVPRRSAVDRAAGTLQRLGLGALTHRSISTLSGGEAQRVAICAALAHDPALILADEPTGELDEAAARQVYALLAEVGRHHGAALILVSHDRRAADTVDRAVRMRDGRLAEQWRPADGTGEAQVVDVRGWLRLPAELLGRSTVTSTTAAAASIAAASAASGPVGPPTAPDPITLTASALPGGDVRLVRRSGSAPVVPSGVGIPVPASRIAVLPELAFPAGVGPRGSIAPVLRFAGVEVVFETRTLFSRVDLALRPGDHVVLRGPSGSGKSTLLGLAAGLSDPTSGTVAVAGVPWGPLDRRERAALRRTSVAVSVQSTILAEALTVAENLRFSAGLRGRRPSEIDSVAADLGLTVLLDQPVGLLSGGERQRVAVARCLVSGAALLLLDEPTSQQDEASAVAVARAVRAATATGRAVLASSHDPVFLDSAGTIQDMATLDRAGDDQPPR